MPVGTAAKNAATNAVGLSTGFGSEAADVGSMLLPTLEQEALHPAGFNPNDLNSMLVAGQQATGGGAGAISGEAGLRAARSRNNASLGGTLDEVAREKMRANSQNALDVQGTNARLKESQRQAGLSGLEKVRGGDINAELEMQKILPEDLNAWTKAKSSEPTMFQDILGTIGALSGAGKGSLRL
jgi:hypothetical protein